jgi:hypothetical protein
MKALHNVVRAEDKGQGYKHEDMNLSELCGHIYTAFGAYAVVNLINDRQHEGYLSEIKWRDCDGCDMHTPIEPDSTCLVCGSRTA